jgi:SAM-dependent methyltransferase
MSLDVVDLREFYGRPLGSAVRRLLTRRIRARWRNVQGAQLMGLGFAVPYIGMFRGEAASLGALMPATQGAVVWPAGDSVQTVLVEEAMLPLADASLDRLLAVHCLEATERSGPLLREIWRVLKPEGRLLLVVPNRRGVWTRLDITPFGMAAPIAAANSSASCTRPCSRRWNGRALCLCRQSTGLLSCAGRRSSRGSARACGRVSPAS